MIFYEFLFFCLCHLFRVCAHQEKKKTLERKGKSENATNKRTTNTFELLRLSSVLRSTKSSEQQRLVRVINDFPSKTTLIPFDKNDDDDFLLLLLLVVGRRPEVNDFPTTTFRRRRPLATRVLVL